MIRARDKKITINSVMTKYGLGVPVLKKIWAYGNNQAIIDHYNDSL